MRKAAIGQIATALLIQAALVSPVVAQSPASRLKNTATQVPRGPGE